MLGLPLHMQLEEREKQMEKKWALSIWVGLWMTNSDGLYEQLWVLS